MKMEKNNKKVQCFICKKIYYPTKGSCGELNKICGKCWDTKPERTFINTMEKLLYGE